MMIEEFPIFFVPTAIFYFHPYFLICIIPLAYQYSLISCHPISSEILSSICSDAVVAPPQQPGYFDHALLLSSLTATLIRIIQIWYSPYQQRIQPISILMPSQSTILVCLLCLFCLEPLVCLTVTQCCPGALLASCLLLPPFALASELSKEHLLIARKLAPSMCMLLAWHLATVYLLVIGLTVLLYISEYELGQVGFSSTLAPFVVYRDWLTPQQVLSMNLVYYFAGGLCAGLYTREYYRVFWVDSVVHVYRYLKKKVKNLNETLLSRLPVVPYGEQLQGMHCPLCLEEYGLTEEITRLECQHYYHRNCVRIWAMRSCSCPICRRRVIGY